MADSMQIIIILGALISFGIFYGVMSYVVYNFDGGYNLTHQWNVGVGARFDITEKKPHQLDHSIKVTYKGDCANITTTISRNYTVDSTRDIKKSGDYNFVIGLRTLSM